MESKYFLLGACVLPKKPSVLLHFLNTRAILWWLFDISKKFMIPWISKKLSCITKLLLVPHFRICFAWLRKIFSVSLSIWCVASMTAVLLGYITICDALFEVLINHVGLNVWFIFMYIPDNSGVLSGVTYLLHWHTDTRICWQSFNMNWRHSSFVPFFCCRWR